MEEDGFLHDGEKETLLPLSCISEDSAPTMRSAAELVKTKKWGAEQKTAKKPHLLLAGPEDMRAMQVTATPSLQAFVAPREISTGLNLPVVHLLQQPNDGAEGGGDRMDSNESQEDVSMTQSGNPIQLAFPLDFSDFFRSTMREEIVLFCQEVVLESLTLCPLLTLLDPILTMRLPRTQANQNGLGRSPPFQVGMIMIVTGKMVSFCQMKRK